MKKIKVRSERFNIIIHELVSPYHFIIAFLRFAVQYLSKGLVRSLSFSVFRVLLASLSIDEVLVENSNIPIDNKMCLTEKEH